MSPPVGDVARSARGASLAQHITACYKHDVMFCAKLTTEQSPHNSVRWRAVKQFNGAKGVWVGETNEVCLKNIRVFPHIFFIYCSYDFLLCGYNHD